MTDGQLDGRTQRCEELSGKGKALSIALHAATQAGDPWLLPLWDFSHHDESVTPWITTAIHLDTPLSQA
jgi:hypothetical protein